MPPGKILVDAYNQWVFHPDSVTESGSIKHSILTDPPGNGVPWGQGRFWFWNGVTVGDFGGQYSTAALVTEGGTADADGNLLPDPVGLAGEIPQTLCQLGRVVYIIMPYNFHTGGIPACFGDLSDLQLLELSSNELSGSIPSRLAANPTNLRFFGAPQNNLVENLPGGFSSAKWINLASNFLSGPLPANIGSAHLSVLDLSNNSFNESIPENYKRDFSRVSQLHLNNNDLSGDFDVSWLNQISFLNMFSRPAFQISENKLCIDTSIPITPRPLVPPLDAEIDSVGYILGKNVDSHGNQLTHSGVDISLYGNICEKSSSPSYSQFILPPITNLQKSLTATNLSLSWDAPVNPATNTPYLIHGYSVFVREAKDMAFSDDGMLKVNATSTRSRGRDLVEGFLIWVSAPDGSDHSPTSLQIPWDSENQQWNTHPTQGDESGFLSQGTAVMFRRGVTEADNLKFAGLSRADENMVLTLRQGWNLLAPATDEFEVDSDNPYVVFEENLVDCENLAGVLAIITYDSMIKEFKLALPCHPNVLPSGYQELDAIDSRDTMYVFFESQLSVPITWDITSQRYGSA